MLDLDLVLPTGESYCLYHMFALHRWKSQFTVRGIQLLSVVYKNKLFANLEIRGRHLEVNFCNADSELLFLCGMMLHPDYKLKI